MLKWFTKNKINIISFVIYVMGCTLVVIATDTLAEYILALIGCTMIGIGNKLIESEYKK